MLHKKFNNFLLNILPFGIMYYHPIYINALNAKVQ